MGASGKNWYAPRGGSGHDADHSQPFLMIQGGRFAGGSASYQKTNAAINLPLHQLPEGLLVQAAIAAKAVEHPRHRAGVPAQLGRFAFEPVDLLQHLDGDEDGVVLKIEDRVRIVEEDVGVEYVVFHVKN